MLDLNRLRLLLELPRRGTITAVAQALSYSPSTISQQLATLERETGVRLLEPVGRRVRLTPQAELLAQHAAGLLEQVERAEAALAGAHDAPSTLNAGRPSRDDSSLTRTRPTPSSVASAGSSTREVGA